MEHDQGAGPDLLVTLSAHRRAGHGTGCMPIIWRSITASELVERLPRLQHKGQAHIDYRHVIWTLVRKPGAFARYRWREELFPSLVFRRAYDALRSRLGERADAEYVRILHLAASRGELVRGTDALHDARSRRAVRRRAGAKDHRTRTAASYRR